MKILQNLYAITNFFIRLNIFFKLRLIGRGSFSVKNIYLLYGHTLYGANKSVEIVGPVYLYSVPLLSGPAVSVCVFVYGL